MTTTKRSVRSALFWTTLVGILLWSSYLFRRASNELRGGQVVKGLFRSYHPPYRHKLGWVIDPKGTRLDNELWLRFGGEQQVNTDGDWASMCRRLNLQMQPYDVEKALKSPSLMFRSDSEIPDLWIGYYGLSHVIFREYVGVFTTEEPPEYVRRLAIEQSDSQRR